MGSNNQSLQSCWTCFSILSTCCFMLSSKIITDSSNRWTLIVIRITFCSSLRKGRFLLFLPTFTKWITISYMNDNKRDSVWGLGNYNKHFSMLMLCSTSVGNFDSPSYRAQVNVTYCMNGVSGRVFLGLHPFFAPKNGWNK